MARWLNEKKDSGSFDSRIDPPAESPHFTLSLILRLHFVPANPPGRRLTALMRDFDGTPVPTLRWNRAAWIKFRTEFRYQAYSTWDRAFILTPPAGYDGFNWPAAGGTRRKVLCTIQVLVQDQPGDTHATITLVRLANPRSHTFRSDDFTLDSGDILPSSMKGYGASWTRYTVPHEIGHLLGLGHVNARSRECRAAPGTSICYGANLPQALNVMGKGSTLDLENAKPWLERAALHTQTSVDAWDVDWASDEAGLRGVDSVRSLKAS